METLFIFNANQNSFFRYRKQNKNDLGYNKILLELITPYQEPLSHWSREDKIILVPPHLHTYVEKIYNELYV